MLRSRSWESANKHVMTINYTLRDVTVPEMIEMIMLQSFQSEIKMDED